MCSRMQQSRRVISPGQMVLFTDPTTAYSAEGVWEGFARLERIKDWLQTWRLVSIPVERYAERSRQTGRLVWAPNGKGFLMALELKGHIRVVTRHANLHEQQTFGHDRVPLLCDTLNA